jgi:hypothetical protein
MQFQAWVSAVGALSSSNSSGDGFGLEFPFEFEDGRLRNGALPRSDIMASKMVIGD